MAKTNGNETKTQYVFRIVAIVLLFIIGLNAFVAGFSFMVEPSGKGIGISTAYLKSSPFTDFFIPGVVLFVFNGILSIGTAVVTIKKTPYYRQLIFLQGVILAGWIVAQIIMARDFNWMHATCLVIAVALLFIGKKLLGR